MNIFLYQIFYDKASYEQLDIGFIPLDNSNSSRPEWYEFWPIREYLKKTNIEDDSWYGFFSPKFERKTGFNADYVKNVTVQFGEQHDVALFSSRWDFVAYFKNVFEQGELWHEHITVVAQEYFKQINYAVDLRKLVNHSLNSVTSNYLTARGAYWKRWLHFADKLYELCESETEYAKLLNRDTTYGSKIVPWKVFIQERLHSVILANEQYRTVVPDQSLNGKIFDQLFFPDLDTRKKLQACDVLKQEYTKTCDIEFLNVYEKIKKEIRIKPTKFR